MHIHSLTGFFLSQAATPQLLQNAIQERGIQSSVLPLMPSPFNYLILFLLTFKVSLHVHTSGKGHVSTRQEGRCLQARKKALPQYQTCWHIDLGLLSLQNDGGENVCFLGHPV